MFVVHYSQAGAEGRLGHGGVWGVPGSTAVVQEVQRENLGESPHCDSGKEWLRQDEHLRIG